MATEEEYTQQLEKISHRPATPGDLLDDLIDCNALTQGEIAERIDVSRATINRIVQGHRAMTPDMAHRLGRLFGNGPDIWLNLQKQVDLWDALHMDRRHYEYIEPIARTA